MRIEEIDAIMYSLDSWKAVGMSRRAAFYKHMKHVHYGTEETRDAWYHFLKGWRAAMRELQMTPWRYSKTQRVRNMLKEQDTTIHDIVDLLGISSRHARAIMSRLVDEGTATISGRFETGRRGPKGYIYRYSGERHEHS